MLKIFLYKGRNNIQSWNTNKSTKLYKFEADVGIRVGVKV
jgi:hypothetical protein